MKKKLSPEFVEIYRRLAKGSDGLRSNPVRELHDWWSGFNDSPPTMADFDIIDFPHLAPNLFLYRVLEPGRYEYRLNGEEVINLTGYSQAGRIFAADGDDEEAAILAGYLNQVIEDRTPWTCGGSMAHLGREHLKFESLDCPLVNESGDVTHVLGLIVRLED